MYCESFIQQQLTDSAGSCVSVTHSEMECKERAKTREGTGVQCEAGATTTEGPVFPSPAANSMSENFTVRSGSNYDELLDGNIKLSPACTPVDVLCLSLHLLMLDSGFTTESEVCFTCIETLTDISVFGM